MSEDQKLSVDLARTAEFLVSGNERMAKIFSGRVARLDQDLPGRIGKYSIRDYLDKVATMSEGRERAIERAYIAADILARRNNG